MPFITDKIIISPSDKVYTEKKAHGALCYISSFLLLYAKGCKNKDNYKKAATGKEDGDGDICATLLMLGFATNFPA